MSEQKHTGGTWVAMSGAIWTEFDEGGKASIADMVLGTCIPLEDAYANAARIVSCVNALAGIDDPAKAIEKAWECAWFMKGLCTNGHLDHALGVRSEAIEMCSKAIVALTTKQPTP